MSQVITRDYQGHVFQFREDGYFNMTKAAKVFGKDLSNFMRSPEAADYIDALSKTVESTELVEAQRGRNGGTWGHPKLAVFFARWLDVKFAVFCDMVIDDIPRKKAELTITKPEESAVMSLPKSFSEALRLAAELEEQKEQLRLQNEAMRPHAVVGIAVGTRNRTTVMDFVKKLPGINTMQVQKTLAALGHLRKADGHWSVYHSSKRYFNEAFDGRASRSSP